jgi:hypothetical protein
MRSILDTEAVQQVLGSTGAVGLGHIPLGIWYLREVETSARDWAFALFYVALFIAVGMLRVDVQSASLS